MTLELLVAAVHENDVMLAEHMNISTDAVICNQCNEVAYSEFVRAGHLIRAYDFDDRGVGRNRNNALLRARGDLVLFGDEDIIYDDDYESKVVSAFQLHPEADLILFNVQVVEERRTYLNTRAGRIHWYNYGRYPTYAVCARRERLQRANVWFSLLFGGGAPYSNGEDSLFLHDCLKKGLRLYASPVVIGREAPRENHRSTWFTGYNEKFFFDRGVLYHHLYGIMALPLALRFVIVKRKVMCQEIPPLQAFSLMREGIRKA